MTARSFVNWTLRHGRLLWILALLLGIPATWRTVMLYANLRSEIEELLPKESPSVQALEELRRRNPGLQFLGVVVDIGDEKNLPAGERFLDDLAARIKKYPQELARDVRTGNGEVKKFVEKHGPLYVEVKDLETLRYRIEKRRDYDIAKESGNLIDEDTPPPPIDTDDIEDKYRHKFGEDNKEKTDRLSSAEQRATMLFVEAGDFSTNVDKARALLSRVQADVKDLGGPERYAPGMTVGYASDIAITVEEHDGLEQDLSISSVAVIGCVLLVIVVYYRWWKSVPVLLAPLLLAAVFAFGVASLPPLNITELNSNTAFLGSIIVGNGINFALILLARYREERMRGVTVDEALVVGVGGAWQGTLAAAAAAGVSYASLVITEFRGFRQFGCIGGFGMLFAWVLAFVLMPPLIKWIDREAPRVNQRGLRQGVVMDRVVGVVERFAPAILVVTAGLAVASAVKLGSFDASQLEHDFNKLRRVDTWENGEGKWGRKMDSLLGHYLTPTVLLFDDEAEARIVEKNVRDAVDNGPLQPMVAEVLGADDVLPPDEPAKVAEAMRTREVLTPKIRSTINEDRRKKLDRMLGDENLHPITADDLPHAMTTGLRERDGSLGRSILVYPRPSDTLWKAEGIYSFVDSLRALASEDLPAGSRAGRVAGSIPLSADILSSITRDAPLASAASFFGVVVVVLIILRARKASLYVLGSLLLGVLLLCGATMFLHIKINFSNFIAFPITFGIGVDYSVNVITRYIQDGQKDIRTAVRETGGAVVLCSMTTIIGYSSLLLAKNRALFLFGLLAVLGEIACLSTAVIVLPAFLRGMSRLRGARVQARES